MEHWSKTPPTVEDVRSSYNGYFWIRYCIMPEHMDEEGIWPSVNNIEATQIFFILESEKGIRNMDKMVIRLMNGGKSLYLDNPEHMKGIEWQMVEPPKGTEANDL